ncbi:forkhead box protein N3-like isoform X2 [Anthonomus grandis grandis]|uniref:forkhead box protein N3-like isoform X2 n=1 Tax=Anthonomus grandis grandis TaxID=2921223 RepID=UPI002165B09F|nr:forkhead box protein N3-like isoform X2 [Anthonomus grandis grandis]
MAPERPGSSQSETAPLPPRMSVPGSPIALTPAHHAQSPISILLAVAQSQKGPDDDLTSLSWLHEGDILKGMNINTSPLNSTTSTPIKSTLSFLPDQSPTSDYVDDSSISTPESSTYSAINSPTPRGQNYYSGNQSNNNTTSSNNNQDANNSNLRHNSNLPYDPLVHVHSKPPYSFSCLIFMAIEDSKQKALPVKEIYAWILDHFPYFKNAPTGWKNSVRHNLSLNKCFQKVEKAPNLGKGSLWTVDPQYRSNLQQALNRSPFHPCSTIDPSVYQLPAKTSLKDDKSGVVNRAQNSPNPDLFPFLSKKLAGNGVVESRAKVKSEPEESLDAVDAAAVMLTLKHATRINIWPDMQVITTSPSQDHTYSAADGENEDEAFESDEDKCKTKNARRKIDFEDDEERRIKEGAETLLNLAGIATFKRSIMNNSNYEPQPKMARCTNNYESMTETSASGEEEPRFVPFKPRLLRTKRKENSSPKKLFNNNQDEWLKHRRELDINQSR